MSSPSAPPGKASKRPQTWTGRIRERVLDDPRLRRVLHGGASGLLARVVNLAINVVTLPLTLHYLGPVEYGVWITLSTSVVMLSLLDLGIANTLTNFIAQAHAENDRGKAGRYFATAFWVSWGIVLALAPFYYLAWHAVNWGSLFQLHDPLAIRHARQCAGIGISFFLSTLPLNLASRVLSGYQESHQTNYFSMANSLTGMVAVLLVITLHGTIVHLMAAFCVAALLGPLLLNIWLWGWNRPWLRPSPLQVQRSIIGQIFGQGFLFFVIQITGIVVFNSDNFVISHYLGAAAVTPYSVAWRLVTYVSAIQALLIPSLWPAFADAYHRRQLAWVRSTYRSIERNTLLLVGSLALLIGLLGRPLIHLWVGKEAVPGTLVLWLMALFAVVVSATSTQALLLTATGRLRLQATVAALAALLNLALSIFLVTRIGVAGVTLGTILSFLLVMILPQAWETRRVLRGAYLDN